MRARRHATPHTDQYYKNNMLKTFELPPSWNERLLFVAFHAFKDCTAPDCAGIDMCRFKTGDEHNKCQLQIEFVTRIETVILREYKNKLDHSDLMFFGMHLIPLYVQLAHLYIEETSVRSVTQISGKGALSAHPIYKEIRDTIKTIESCWREYRFRDRGIKPRNGKQTSEKIKDAMFNGEDYYARMESEALNEQDTRKASRLARRQK